MNTKQIIQIAVIVLAFGLCGVVLYNGFFKDNNKPALGQALLMQQGSAQQSSQEILPYGKTLNFEVLKKRNFLYNQVDYPRIDAKDIGVPEDMLIVVPQTTPQS